MDKVLVTGLNGQLGQCLQARVNDYPQFAIDFVTRKQLDLSKSESITAFFKDKTYDAIVNCAAYTAVDRAESESEQANQVNHLAVKQLAEVAKLHDATLIHISTDYVFDGQNYQPYQESDKVDPKSVYGLTKLKGEQAIQAINPKGCIIRTSWVYSEYGNNFVKTMLRLGQERELLNVIYDQVGAPTYAGDLAKAILDILAQQQLMTNKKKSSTTLYHFSNEGVCSWYDFAKTIFELRNIRCKVSPIETKDYPTPAKRPHYSLMNKTKIKHEFAVTIPYWKDSLKTCLTELEKNT